jgi:hypothetical protein
MTTILVDYNMEGQAAILRREVINEGWPELLPLELATFAMIGLLATSSDRVIWRFAQEQRMTLLTNKRNARVKARSCRQFAKSRLPLRFQL